MCGHHPERLELLPAGTGWCPSLLEARDYDLIVEATGRPEVVQQALACARPRGTVVLKTTAEHPASLDLAPLGVTFLKPE